MDWVRITAGGLTAASGLVWAAQGLNMRWAPGSFMTGSRAWVVIGLAAMVVGVVLVTAGIRGLRRGPPDGE